MRLQTELGIAYHGGGEPAAHWGVLTDSFAYAVQKAETFGMRACGRLISNGVLRDDKIDWIIANINYMMVSFDGLPSIQAAQRKTASGHDSSRLVRK